MTAPSLDVPTAMADLVTVQPGSVVSQTLIKRSVGTVTAFAFAAGQGLSEHVAPFEALVLGLAGAATVTVGGTPHRLAAGDGLRLPAEVPHALQADEDFKMLLIMIRAADGAGHRPD